ncbi:MOFRL family protein, partial [Massilia sp. CT11-108]|uniref:MOFRL family protein n=1 Tax=Massilia sp. CT11-108 TaxID=3393900 RepID=UPI0039A494B2
MPAMTLATSRASPSMLSPRISGVTPDTLARGWERGLPPRASLENNDAHTFFRALGDSLITGPTLTNVNDFRAIYVA